MDPYSLIQRQTHCEYVTNAFSLQINDRTLPLCLAQMRLIWMGNACTVHYFQFVIFSFFFSISHILHSGTDRRYIHTNIEIYFIRFTAKCILSACVDAFHFVSGAYTLMGAVFVRDVFFFAADTSGRFCQFTYFTDWMRSTSARLKKKNKKKK